MHEYHPRRSSIATALRCACPRCGKGAIFDGLLSVRQSCANCGLDFSRFRTDDAAAFFIIVLYSAAIIPLAVWLEFAWQPPIWVHLLVWIPVVLVGSVALMRPLKAWFIAQHYRHDIVGPDPAP